MRYRSSGVQLSEIRENELDDEKNFIQYEGKTYHLRYLSADHKTSKGGNSNVYVLHDKSGKNRDRAIKICKYYKPGRYSNDTIKKRHGRFMNEIDALYTLKNSQRVVQIDFDGLIDIFIEKNGKTQKLEFPYYVMEKADTDLKEFLLKNTDIDEQDRVQYCLDIFTAIKELHDEDFYHRDIKPDNILLFLDDQENEKVIWKIGDLGLINHRDKDYDDIGERIGPLGWLSPEAMNKILTEEAGMNFDCKIDKKSDIFQLGKLFWFIFQLNAPIGQVYYEDFVCKAKYKSDIFALLSEMLKYSKDKRADREFVDLFLIDIAGSYGLA